MAPTRRAHEILMEFSCDEKRHAERFMDAYCRLTGRNTNPVQHDHLPSVIMSSH